MRTNPQKTDSNERKFHSLYGNLERSCRSVFRSVFKQHWWSFFMKLVNSFITEVPIIKKPVHWFDWILYDRGLCHEKTNGLEKITWRYSTKNLLHKVSKNSQKNIDKVYLTTVPAPLNFIKKKQRRFTVNFWKSLRGPILKNSNERLLLTPLWHQKCILCQIFH